MSLRTRLWAGLAATAVVLIVVAVSITRTTIHELYRQIDDQLLAVSDRPLRPLPGSDPSGRAAPESEAPKDLPSQPTPSSSDVRLGPMYEGSLSTQNELVTIFASDSNGTALPPPDITTALVERHGDGQVFEVGSADGSVHYRAIARRFGAGWEIHALPTSDVDSTLSTLIRWEVIGLFVVLMTLSAVAFWVDRLGLRPVKRMTAVAARIADGNIGERIPDSAHPRTEAAALGSALNAMLERIEASTSAQAASEARLRRFVSDASHELRTPITTINGYAELYRVGGLGTTEALDDAMRRIEEEAQRTARLVEDMLTLAKLDEQRPLQMERVDLAAMATDVANDARVALASQSPTSTPQRVRRIVMDATCPAMEVVGDPDGLRQVLTNVVGNGIVHTTGDVRLRVAKLDGSAVVIVEDDGPGMTSATAARVTERFYRVDHSRSRHAGGSGLGLAITQGVMAAHGGDVSIHSAPDTGTTVVLTLPLPDKPDEVNKREHGTTPQDCSDGSEVTG
ncbi:MAG: HAMP domain-containing histidine kinase [Actinobacteria bacterium]|nr:HAMP domain-containing histidine kinase [Actinomycetota bacterium]